MANVREGYALLNLQTNVRVGYAALSATAALPYVRLGYTYLDVILVTPIYQLVNGIWTATPTYIAVAGAWT